MKWHSLSRNYRLMYRRCRDRVGFRRKTKYFNFWHKTNGGTDVSTFSE